VEVGQQDVHHLELEARRDEDLRRPGAWKHLAAARQNGGFQGAYHRRSHRHDPAIPVPGAADRLGGLGADFVAFALHAVILDPLGRHRLEGADPHVQRHPGDLDAGGGDLFQQALREVETGRGCGHGSGAAGVDRLIALAVLRRVRPVDVRWQGDVAQPLQVGLDRLGEAQEVAAVLALEDHLGNEVLVQLDHRPRLGPAPGLHQRVPLPFAEALDQQQLHLSRPAGATAEEASGNHPRVVEDQQVAREQQAGEVRHLGVTVRALAVEHQQAALASRRGLLRDARRRQLEVEVAG